MAWVFTWNRIGMERFSGSFRRMALYSRVDVWPPSFFWGCFRLPFRGRGRGFA